MQPLVGPPSDPRARAFCQDAAILAAGHSAMARAGAAPWTRLRLRRPGFPTLVQLILEQQVSTVAAAAMWRRLIGELPRPTPRRFLTLDDATLKACGFSRQKTVYARGLAEAILDGRFDPDAVAGMDDEAALEAICALKGFGRWTAECYLLFALGRRDMMPAADLALQVGWQWLAGLSDRPDVKALRVAAADWAPYRSAAALLIWRFYLSDTARRRSDGSHNAPG